MAMKKCTWRNGDGRCTKEAEVPQIGRDGKQWADLCGQHDLELTATIKSSDPKRIIGGWIAACGGATAMTKKMLG